MVLLGRVASDEAVEGRSDLRFWARETGGCASYDVRVFDGDRELRCHWRATERESHEEVVNAGLSSTTVCRVEVDSDAIQFSSAFLWIEGIGDVVVDFQEEDLHLVYENAKPQFVREHSQRFEIHRRRIERLLTLATNADDGRATELQKQVQAEQELLSEILPGTGAR